MPTTVLGQPVAEVPGPVSPALVVVLIDVDDFEVLRLARGDDWAHAQLGLLEQALDQPDLTARSAVLATFISPDAWLVTLGGDLTADLVPQAVEYGERVRSSIDAQHEITVSVGVSRAHTGPSRMEMALAEAASGIDRKLIEPGNQVTVYTATEPSEIQLHGRIEQDLARAIRNSDVSGALDVLSRWIDQIAAAEGVTPDVLRRWVTAEVMYALDVSGRERLPDGSVDWFDAFSRLSLEEVMEMSGIHDRSYLMLWLQRLLDRIVQVNTSSAGRHVLALVEQYIKDHHAEDLRLSTLAAGVFVSPYYISHLFQRELGTTFLKYLTGVRLQHARKLLAETDIAVEVISVRVGYVSSKWFRTMFKRTFKVTPTEYRMEHGKR
jgi:AraC-like DNA-binding protein